jgi:hypothetical protein
MPDWKATRYRKTAVVFEERTYFVASRTPLSGGVWRYVLSPWPEDLNDEPGNVVHYDEAYVGEREAGRQAQQRHEKRALGLFFVNSLLGFLFSGVKLRLNERYAIDPIAATRRSVFFEFLVLINLGALLVIGSFASVLSGAYAGRLVEVFPLRILLFAAALVAIDAVIRKDRLERGGMRQYGFCEWLFRRLRNAGDP